MTNSIRGALLVLLQALACGAIAQAQTTPGTPPLAPADAVLPTAAIPGVVAAGTRIEFLHDGFQGTEGPLGWPDGSLLFTENQGDRITRISADGSRAVFLEGVNGANALALSSGGDIVAVQTQVPQVGIIYPADRRRVLAEQFEGLPFGRPNDLVVDSRGNVYFTDSGANAPTAAASAPAKATALPAVYRITVQGRLERLAFGIDRPNGIQLSPDERVLYVANTGGGHVLAFDIAADGSVGPRRDFARLEGLRRTATGWTSGADGLAVDAEGRLYVATTLGVQVFSARGEALGTIVLPRAPQNLAFAGADRKTLYAVGRGAAWRLPVLTAGIAGRAK